VKKLLLIGAFVVVNTVLFARHIAGGELYYEYLGAGSFSNSSKYKITLRLFRDCNSSGPLLETEQVIVGIYQSNQRVNTLNLTLEGPVSTLELNTAAFPCLTGNVNVCYQVAFYSNTIELPITFEGYTLARMGCCRINDITNITGGANTVGNTFVTQIPGTQTLPTGFNNSPQFNVRDTALVCSGKLFALDFGATDADGDLLTYSFCDAFTAPQNSNNAPPPMSLNLNAVPYISPFSGTDPLSGVTINNTSGQIRGIAPGIGQYIVSVCVTEWRNGKAIAEHRKDFILKVQDCDYLEASLPDKIVQCNNFNVYFENESYSSSIINYLWEFGDGFNSNQPTPTHTYADTGTYKAYLTVFGPTGCVGKDSTKVVVYPGFYPGFTFTGNCYQNPFNFTDTTKTNYGVVNKWSWNFGDALTINDTANQKNASYTYSNSGTKTVVLTVSNSKGCEGIVEKIITVSDKPFLQLPFKDTLICSIDTLSINAIGSGNFTWTPNKNIIQANTANPKVYPKDTIKYYVTLNDNGCITKDSITVNVVDYVTVNAGADTSICKTDYITLQPTSYALNYSWQSSTNIPVASVKSPIVQPLVNTTYYVTANVGKCQSKDSVFVKVAPYPISNAGNDTSICFGTKAFLKGSMVGSSFVWQPNTAIINTQTLNPIAAPSKNTYYYLIVQDTLGCNKAVKDSVLVEVLPPLNIFAGNDTAVTKNQPLQLQALVNQDYSSLTYQWSPATGLNKTNISNPIATLNNNLTAITYKVKITTAQGCVGEDDITVKIFNTSADIFIPTAFTPNKDGKNDVFRPVCVGITKLNFFKVFNRWGQQLYETKEMNKGWDGKINGTPATPGTYVFMAEGIDYTGKLISKKGTVVLIY
jgi:gliding motility-associated-like protein